MAENPEFQPRMGMLGAAKLEDYEIDFEFDARRMPEKKRKGRFLTLEDIFRKIAAPFRAMYEKSGYKPLEEGAHQDHWINQTQASLMFGAVILANLMIMGVEIETEDWDGWNAIEIIFLLIFSVEIRLRWNAEGCDYLKDVWNIGDVSVVFVGWLGILVWLIKLAGDDDDGDEGAYGLLTLLRIFRLFRLVRFIRLVRLFKELALLLSGIVKSLKVIFWVGLFLALVIFVYSIVMTRLVGKGDTVLMLVHNQTCGEEYYTIHPCTPRNWNGDEILTVPPCRAIMEDRGDYDLADIFDDPFILAQSQDHACTILSWFGKCSHSAYSLFTIMTLEKWPEFARLTDRPEFRLSVHIKVFTVLYVLFVYFSNILLLSVVTGVIVEHVLILARKEELDELKRQEEEKRQTIVSLHSLFAQMDLDGSGDIAREEFQEALTQEPCLEALRRLEIQPFEAEDLFDILDVDNSNSVSLSEFVEGFSRVKGVAKAKHLLKFHCDAGKIKQIKEAIEKVGLRNEQRRSRFCFKVTQSLAVMERKLHTLLAPDRMPWVYPPTIDQVADKHSNAQLDPAKQSKPGVLKNGSPAWPEIDVLHADISRLAELYPEVQAALAAAGPEYSVHLIKKQAMTLAQNLGALQEHLAAKRRGHKPDLFAEH